MPGPFDGHLMSLPISAHARKISHPYHLNTSQIVPCGRGSGGKGGEGYGWHLAGVTAKGSPCLE